MRITQEADYAVRIIHYLALTGEKCDAKNIAENVGVSTRFALKILGKLGQCGFIRSFKGASGGYVLERRPEEITLLDIVTAIDGPIAINKCLTVDSTCSHTAAATEEGGCPFRKVFDEVSRDIEAALGRVSFARFMQEE
ncbi:MAG: Rrf2 family transcriptional regulator [Clostridia bacterium]|nr:Rrf2 family transcriptional regulator [Clostridia bacterium]MBQ3076250.1 Rrf2 family transcriptional regulator [Clostridia bacterium]